MRHNHIAQQYVVWGYLSSMYIFTINIYFTSDILIARTDGFSGADVRYVHHVVTLIIHFYQLFSPHSLLLELVLMTTIDSLDAYYYIMHVLTLPAILYSHPFH